MQWNMFESAPLRIYTIRALVHVSIFVLICRFYFTLPLIWGDKRNLFPIQLTTDHIFLITFFQYSNFIVAYITQIISIQYLSEI